MSCSSIGKCAMASTPSSPNSSAPFNISSADGGCSVANKTNSGASCFSKENSSGDFSNSSKMSSTSNRSFANAADCHASSSVLFSEPMNGMSSSATTGFSCVASTTKESSSISPLSSISGNSSSPISSTATGSKSDKASSSAQKSIPSKPSRLSGKSLTSKSS